MKRLNGALSLGRGSGSVMGSSSLTLHTAVIVGMALAGVVPHTAQDHESRFEMTESFIRDQSRHPVRAVDVTLEELAQFTDRNRIARSTLAQSLVNPAAFTVEFMPVRQRARYRDYLLLTLHSSEE